MNRELLRQNSTVTVNSPNGLTFNTGIPTINLGGLAGSAGFALNNSNNTAGVLLDVGGNGASTAYSGALGGSGGFVKTGSGTLLFGGTAFSTYSGGTTVVGGTLNLAGCGLLVAAPRWPTAASRPRLRGERCTMVK